MISKALLLIGMSPVYMVALFSASCILAGVLLAVLTIDLIAFIEKRSEAKNND